MSFFSRFMVCLLAGLSLSACVLPENIDATVEVRTDGSYTVSYVGGLAYVPARAAVIDHGRLTAAQEDQLRDGVAKFAGYPGVTKASYSEGGHYQIEYKRSFNAGVNFGDSPSLSVFPTKDGKIIIKTFETTQQFLKDTQLGSINAKGTLKVIVPGSMEVVSASVEPKRTLWIAGDKVYTMPVGVVGQTPSVVVKWK